ncbi:hypothetical protein EHQ68_06665 [Leptospira congkakensis]|uniref:Uncharacterized protein n=1 Tax=Leptospira congkakensis TaxID=2484932 RepID=A0A4Z1AD16_9LEPT|nr:hypothetical protein [Leptospira congkakensis]TGL87704.1 hypothetical protein EHQ69_16495 [Leptospira congkakensis]TGL89680.1 hypothetical protein EHQ68_06665 [Leptospira congkakensis]TGL95854.1 hypothetical protein EHQ70_12165 [Leptospira congkakensis]
MADQEQNKNEDLENIEPVLDEDSFSLDLDDFDMGDDDLDVSPGIEAPNLDDISAFDDEDDSISDMVASSDSYDDLLDIDLDSDLNLLGEEDPILHDEDIHADFSDYEEESEKEKTPSKPKQSHNQNNLEDDDLELEFDDDLIDLDKEIESILNGEDGILTSKKSKQDLDEEEDGPISLSLEELENITGNLEEEDHSGEPERSHFEEEEEEHQDDLIDEHSDLDLDLDDSEIDTNLAFDEEGKPQFDLTDHDEADSFIPKDDLGLGDEEEEATGFQPLVDPEEEELFGKNKEDENLTLSDEELGSILGAGGEASLEESLGSEEEFLTSDEESELPSFTDEDGGFDLLGGEFGTPEEETPSTEEEDEGPLTLSLEELENISGEAIEEDFEEPTSDILNEELEDESITLSPDELGNIIASDPIEEAEDSEEEESHELETDLGDDFDFDLGDESGSEESDNSEEGLEGQMEGFESSEEDEGPIALSMEELESIASDAEESSEEELVDSLDRAPLPYEEDLAPKSDLLAEDEEDESIALSMEELENITASEEEEDEQEDITLSAESLDEILGEELPGEELEDIADLPLEEEFSLSEQTSDEEPVDFDLPSFGDDDLVEHESEADFGDFGSESVIDDSFDLSTPDSPKETRTPTLASDDSEEYEVDLDEYAMEGKLSPLEELRKSDVSAPEAKPSAEEAFAEAGGDNLSVGERKKVLGYLDNLLGNLPDDVIREFSKSQYFELYKKMMKELEL